MTNALSALTASHLAALLLALSAGVVFAFLGFRYRGQLPKTRDYPLFATLADEVGRASEEGALIHVTLGHGSIVDETALTTVAALESLTPLFDLAAAYDTPPIITTGDPTLYILADDWMRRAYARLGNVQRYRPALVQFMAASPLTYAAVAATYLYEKGVGSNIMLGAFNAEASLIADAATRRGSYTAAGATSISALAALYPALPHERLIMGEDLFAGGAKSTHNTGYLVSLLTQDVLRWLLIFVMSLLAARAFLGIGG